MTRSCGLSPTNARCILSYCVTCMYMSATDILFGLAKFEVQNGAIPEKKKTT